MKKVSRILLLAVLVLCMTLPLASCGSIATYKTTGSAYDVAVAQGYTGTVDEWLESLKGKSAYEIWLEEGNVGTKADFLASLSTTVNHYDVTVNAGDEEAVAAKSLLSVVSVYSKFVKTYTVRTGYYRVEQRQTEYSAAGSGVIYKLDKTAGDAYIITNYHVVFDKENESTSDGVSADISLFLYGKEYEQYAIPATYVGGSMYYDIAVLKVSDSDILRASAALEAELLPENETVSVGGRAIAVGNPEAGGISATSGIVCVDSEYITMKTADEKSTVSMRVLRIDTAINSGNSGGGLFDAAGRLIGITNAKIVDTSTENIAYAIPVRVAQNVADNILYYCTDGSHRSVRRCMLGISVSTEGSAAVYDPETGCVSIRETVAISEVSSDGAAGDQLKKGDIVLSVTLGDRTYDITRSYMLIDAMLTARPGDAAVFRILRDGAEQTVTVQITTATLTDY